MNNDYPVYPEDDRYDRPKNPYSPVWSSDKLQTMNNTQTTYIYESPDGGNTVYRRLLGGSPGVRELYSQPKNLDESLEESKLWSRIRSEAKNDTALKEMLDQIKVYWSLKNIP